jgi:serine protease
MRTILIYIFTFCILAIGSAQEKNKTLILKLKSTSDKQLSEIEETLKIRIAPLFEQHYNKRHSKFATRLSNIYAIEAPKVRHKQIISYLQKQPEVAYIVYKPEVKLFEIPDDPNIGSQYYIDLINMYDAWDIETGDTTVIIGIVDTGTDLLHNDLQRKLAYNYNDPVNGVDDDQDGFVDNYYGWDLSENNNNPQVDNNYHGAKVAGIAAAATNNAIGIAGIGYNLKYLPVKTMNGQGQLDTPWEGVIYAADHGADVIICSWGGIGPNAFGRDIIQYATIDKGAIVVAAAGNYHSDVLFYPASYPEVISVTATNQNDQKWVGNNGSGATYGYTVDIAAPGQSIYILNEDNQYSIGTGTSYAAPIVGAIAGLIKSNRPHLNAEQIKQQILNTTYLLDTIPQNVLYTHQLGSGRIDGYAALTDTMISGVALNDMQIQGEIVAGNTIYLTGEFVNHLQNAVINISIESFHDDATVLTTSIDAGILSTGGKYILGENEIPIQLSEDMSFDQEVVIKFSIDDGANSYYRLFPFIANPSYRNLTTNNLNATIAANGRIGFANLDPILGDGIWTDNVKNMIWEGGLIYGNSNTQTLSSFMGSEGFSIEQGVTTTTEINGDIVATSQMCDTNKNNAMNICTHQKVIASNNSNLTNTLIYEYHLFNNSDQAYEDFHVGLFFDWDLDLTVYNHIYMNNEYQIAVCENVIGDSRLIGVKLIDKSFYQYAFELNEDTEGINIIDGFTNEEKWFALSNQRDEAGLGTGDDVAHMISTEGFTFEAGDSIKLTYIITTGTHESNIITQIQSAEQYVTNINEQEIKQKELTTYPNPFINSISISAPKEIVSIAIFDNSGKLTDYIETNEKTLDLNLEELNRGLYLIKATDINGIQYFKKIIKE